MAAAKRAPFYTGGMRSICFLSDFGLADDFVGTCKGVMLRTAPGVQIVDLAHEVPGFGIETGAEILAHATRYMPEDTVFLAVVDPGVGTERRALALRAESGALLVGPDNGLLIPATNALGGVAEAVLLTNGDYHIHPVSNTFHGRDLFSPAAAHLAAGLDISRLGESVDIFSLAHMDLPGVEVNRDGHSMTVRIMDIDRYGNARLSIMHDDAGLNYGDALYVDTGDGNMSVRYLETFGAAKSGELVLVPDSHWRLSLAINKGNAAHALGLKVGLAIRLEPSQDGKDDAGP